MNRYHCLVSDNPRRNPSQFHCVADDEAVCAFYAWCEGDEGGDAPLVRPELNNVWVASNGRRTVRVQILSTEQV